MSFDNLKTMQLVTQIKTLISDSQLPVCIIYYMLKDLSNEVEQLYSEIVQAEQKTYLENQEKLKETVIKGAQEAPLHFEEIVEDLREPQKIEEAGQE